MPTGDVIYEVVSLPTAAQLAFAAAPASYYIGPGGSDSATGLSGDPWASWDAYEARIGDAELNELHTVTLLGDVPRIRPPRIGAAGHLRIVGQPTTIYEGTLTAGTLPPDPATHRSTTLVDSAQTIEWGNLMAMNDGFAVRVRITSGARAGAVGWVVADLAPDNDGRASRFFADAATPLDDFSIVSFSAFDPEVGDPYAVELLPRIADLQLDRVISTNSETKPTKLSFWSIAVPYLGATIVPSAKTYGTVFVGCDLPGIIGAINAVACRLDQLDLLPGSDLFARGCAFTQFLNVEAGARLMIDECLAELLTIFVAAGGTMITFGGFAVFDAYGPGLAPSGNVTLYGALWGNGNAGVGIEINDYGVVVRYATAPTVTGNGGDFAVLGVVHAYAALPFFSSSTGIGIAP